MMGAQAKVLASFIREAALASSRRNDMYPDWKLGGRLIDSAINKFTDIAAYGERHDESTADVRKILLQLERAKALYEELGAQAK